MLAAAQEIEPSIDWVLCAAEDLLFDEGEFDVVTSQFGMMFFDDRSKAAEEMYRGLRPGGTVSIAVWRAVERNPAYADIIAVLDEQVGQQAGDALRLPFSLGNADEVITCLEQAGFRNVAVEAKTESARFPGTRTMVEAELRGWLPLFDIVLGEDEINNVLVASDQRLAKYAASDGSAIFPISASIFTARKP
jgi:SAM-dependent methyltransferase